MYQALNLHALYLPAAILGFAMLWLPRADMVFYFAFSMSFVLSLVIVRLEMWQRSPAVASLGGIMLPLVAAFETVPMVSKSQDLPVVLIVSTALCLQTNLAARALNAPITPFYMLIPFFNAVGVTAGLRAPHRVSALQLASIFAITLVTSIIAAVILPQPKMESATAKDDSL